LVLYHGGEPLINKNFFKMVDLVKSNRPDIYIKTVSNGNVLNAKIIDRLLKSSIEMIEFSLDGQNVLENNHIRIGCDGDKVLSQIQLLIQKRNTINNNLKIYISTTQFYDDMVQVDSSKADECPKYIEEVLPLGRRGVSGYKTNYAMVWPHMGKINDNFSIIQDNSSKRPIVKCDMLDNTITIRWNGDIVPCCYDLTSKMVMGNVRQDTLKDIWNNVKYENLRESIKSRKHISICRSCSVVNKSRYLVPKWRKKHERVETKSI
jgi:radical SAM protein with 4Fe4S-binding SPASM domain